MDVYALTSKYVLGTDFDLTNVAAAQPVDQGNPGNGFATSLALDHNGLAYVFGAWNTPAGTEYLKLSDKLASTGTYVGTTFREDPAITSPTTGSKHRYLLAGYDPKTGLVVALNTNQGLNSMSSPGSWTFQPPEIDSVHAWKPNGDLVHGWWPSVAVDATTPDPLTLRQGGFVGLNSGGWVGGGRMLNVVGNPVSPFSKYLLSTDIATGAVTTLKVFDDINYANYILTVSEDDDGNIYVVKRKFQTPDVPMTLEVYDSSMALMRTVTLDGAGVIPRFTGGTFPTGNNMFKVRPDGARLYLASGFPLVSPMTLWALDTTTGAVATSLVVPDQYLDPAHSAGFVVLDWGFVGNTAKIGGRLRSRAVHFSV